MAIVSYLRPSANPEEAAQRAHRRLTNSDGSPRRGRYVAGGVIVLLLGGIAALAIVFVSAQATLTVDSVALAKVGLPIGGGTIESVSVVTGPHSAPIPAELRGKTIWPKGRIPAHQMVTIDVTVKRPGWISWLSGKTQHLQLTTMTPSASLRSHYLTLRPGQPIVLAFKQPIRTFAYGTPGHMTRRELATPQSRIRLTRTAEAGTFSIAAAPRSWESAKSTLVSWFPAGGSASAVATPAPGSQILPHTALTLAFSKPVKQALGNNRPVLTPATPGTWDTVTSHEIRFTPSGEGYGLAAHVSVALPSGVRLVGGQSTGVATAAHWTVPGGSTVRLQQLLSILGYLPFNFKYASGHGVGLTPAAQETAAIRPPAGKFDWRYPNVPSQLKNMWQAGTNGTMTKGALMAFQNDHALTADGVPGVAVWRSLITAAIEGKRSSFGYTYVNVSIGSQQLHLWHSGKDVMSTAVNTGIASAPTATGTYPVFEHLPVTTMSGTNPDGSHYSDPGIQWVSYFNGGDALHSFTRAQYGFPQSLGCVEMALAPAAQVYPYTPIGTLVTVS